MNSKLTAEGIMGAAMRMSAELSGGEFPITVFPHKIQRIITELHASQGYPIDYIATAMLSALAVSIGNSHLAQVKRGWVESPILYMALIGRPGANKSHPLSFAFHPFIEHDYRPVVKPIKVDPPPPSFIEPKMMQLSMQHYEKNHLYHFLKTVLGRSAASELMQRYNVGSSKHWTGATVFWQVDISGKIRTGKVMLYNPENGRRIKEPHNHITLVHSLLKKEKFHLRQCLFGEHLLTADSHQTVALVESEKSALIASHFLPQYLWIATGGKNGAFNKVVMSVLKNRQVLLFPDLGVTDYWRGKMEMMQRLGIEVSLFGFMENNATDEERKAGYDIADYLLKAETKEFVLSRMIARNSHLEALISTLDLEVVGVEKLS